MSKSGAGGEASATENSLPRAHRTRQVSSSLVSKFDITYILDKSSWRSLVSGPDRAMDKNLASDTGSRQLSPRNYHYYNRVGSFGYGPSGGTPASDYWRGLLWPTPVHVLPGPAAVPSVEGGGKVKSARHLWGLRKKAWWKHVGFVWIFCTILVPTAAFATSVHK